MPLIGADATTNEEDAEPSQEVVETRNLIQYLSLQVTGIGEKTAATLAILFDDLQAFLNATEEDLRKLKKVSGRSVLRDELIAGLLGRISLVKKGLSTRETWMHLLIKDFIVNVKNLIESSKVPSPSGAFDEDALLINPFLIRALGFTQPDEVLKFFFYQRVARAIVTSWGMRIELIANRSGSIALTKLEKEGVFKGFDSKKIEGDKTSIIQIKSGTNTMPVDMVRQLDERIKALEAIDSTYRGVVGLTYGNADEVSDKMARYLEGADERVKVGREFWEWLSGEPDYYAKLLAIITEVGREVWTEGDFLNMFDEKYKRLRQEWVDLYGDGPESVERFMERFS